MSLDLKKLADKLDESLNNETTESLTDWLGEKRMSNNKQSMKLYTKEDFLKAAEFCEVSMIDAKYIIERIDEVTTPNELPNDEEIENRSAQKAMIKKTFEQKGLAYAKFIDQQMSDNKQSSVAISHWQEFDWHKIETRPKEYGKYLICRKDGKIHWETWNGSGWAYNHNEVRFWAIIISPFNNATFGGNNEQ